MKVESTAIPVQGNVEPVNAAKPSAEAAASFSAGACAGSGGADGQAKPQAAGTTEASVDMAELLAESSRQLRTTLGRSMMENAQDVERQYKD